MKKIRNRSYSTMIIAAALVLGLCIYTARLYAEGKDWVMLRANQSVFNQGVLDTGVLYDRNGVVLAKAGNGVYAYSDEENIRKACFHAVGDYAGNVGTGALTAFNHKMAGYNFINGVATLDGNGGKVKLSIDSSLNVVAYNALGGRRGSVLVSNYKTGEVLCMVSTPSYDPNSPPDLNSPMYEGVFMNRCLGAAYTPGSVFKLITLAAALENIPDLKKQTYNCSGSTTVNGDRIQCTSAHGMQTIEVALANSCNVAFSEISQELGPDIIYEYAESYGLLKSHTISGVETAAGSMSKANTGTSDLSWMGIGQYNNLVTPISMLRFVSAVANDGIIKEPVLLKNKPSPESRLLEKETASEIKAMMSYNVSYSYGSSQFPNLKICAKTGTAEVGDGTSHAWFVGFLDDDENPFAFTIVVEKGGGGLANAGPVANSVLQAAVFK